MTESTESSGTERGYLGLEIGELAAWVALAWGARGPERRWRTRFKAPPDLETLFQRIMEGVGEIGGSALPAGIGVASWMPGAGERDRSRSGAASLDWSVADLTSQLSERLGALARQCSAVDAAALAEASLGAGTGASPLAYVHLGREVLSALAYEGKSSIGAQGRPGQIGHWRVTDGGPRCSCGAIGHLNPLCSSQSFVRLAIGLAAQDDDALAAVRAATDGRAESLTAGRVVALASAGVEPLRDLVRRSADALGDALAQLALVIQPEVIVLGGPLGVSGGIFLDWTRARLAADIRAVPAMGDAPQLIPASLEPYSALTGAWLMGQRQI